MRSTKEMIRLVEGGKLVPLTEDYDKPLAKGTLVCYKAFGSEREVTAAYPIWRVLGKRIDIVLFWGKETGRPCIDQTYYGMEYLYVNDPPIVLDIDVEDPLSFGESLFAALAP